MIHRSRFVHSGVLALILCVSLVSTAQGINLKLGFFDPKGAKTGFIFGISSSRGDEMVDYGLGLDFFVRRYVKETVVSVDTTGQTIVSEVRTDLKYSLFALPLMGHLTIRLLPGSAVRPYFTVGAGYELALSREANYYENIDPQTRFYHGFGMQFMLGGEYTLTPTSALLGELFYNVGKLRRSGTSDQGFPTQEQLDFSGIGFRVGARISAF
jgi:hypothetical protein